MCLIVSGAHSWLYSMQFVSYFFIGRCSIHSFLHSKWKVNNFYQPAINKVFLTLSSLNYVVLNSILKLWHGDKIDSLFSITLFIEEGGEGRGGFRKNPSHSWESIRFKISNRFAFPRKIERWSKTWIRPNSFVFCVWSDSPPLVPTNWPNHFLSLPHTPQN